MHPSPGPGLVVFLARTLVCLSCVDVAVGGVCGPGLWLGRTGSWGWLASVTMMNANAGNASLSHIDDAHR